jgi:hypothetical protein
MNFPARRHEPLAAIKRSIKRSSVATALYRRFTNEAATQTGRHFAKSSLSLPVHQTSKPDENSIRTYFNSHRQGPGIWKWDHYFDVYHRHFSKFRGRKVTVVEIGVYSGGSLLMWRDYFGADCTIYGVDIESECLVYENAFTHILIGDQADPRFWAKAKQSLASSRSKVPRRGTALYGDPPRSGHARRCCHSRLAWARASAPGRCLSVDRLGFRDTRGCHRCTRWKFPGAALEGADLYRRGLADRILVSQTIHMPQGPVTVSPTDAELNRAALPGQHFIVS